MFELRDGEPEAGTIFIGEVISRILQDLGKRLADLLPEEGDLCLIVCACEIERSSETQAKRFELTVHLFEKPRPIPRRISKLVERACLMKTLSDLPEACDGLS